MVRQLVQLNSIGEILGRLPGVHALTDVTGFGLLGHLTEMCEGSGTSAEIVFADLPVIPSSLVYLEQKAIPGGTTRNWKSYGHKVSIESDEARFDPVNILADPQTNGGLLISVDPAGASEVQDLLKSYSLFSQPVGRIVAARDQLVRVL
jgi:selenide,water dikinase